MFMPNYEQMFQFPTGFLKQWKLLHRIKLSLRTGPCLVRPAWKPFSRQCKSTHNLPIRHTTRLYCWLMTCCCQHQVCGLWRPGRAQAVQNLTRFSTLPKEARHWLLTGQIFSLIHVSHHIPLGWYMVRYRSQTSQNEDHFQMSLAHLVGNNI